MLPFLPCLKVLFMTKPQMWSPFEFSLYWPWWRCRQYTIYWMNGWMSSDDLWNIGLQRGKHPPTSTLPDSIQTRAIQIINHFVLCTQIVPLGHKSAVTDRCFYIYNISQLVIPLGKENFPIRSLFHIQNPTFILGCVDQRILHVHPV